MPDDQRDGAVTAYDEHWRVLRVVPVKVGPGSRPGTERFEPVLEADREWLAAHIRGGGHVQLEVRGPRPPGDPLHRADQEIRAGFAEGLRQGLPVWLGGEDDSGVVDVGGPPPPELAKHFEKQAEEDD